MARNKTHQFFVYADDDNLVGENTNVIKKNTEALLDASKEAVSRTWQRQ
jgi:hypothetical protein